MGFLFACEEVIRKYLPAVRAGVAKRLYREGFTQQEIAGVLGLTQPAVFKYLKNDYGSEVRKVEERKFLSRLCDEISAKIVSSKWGSKQVVKAVCSACSEYNADAESCQLENFAAKVRAKTPHSRGKAARGV